MTKKSEPAKIVFDDSKLGEQKNSEISSLLKKLSESTEPIDHIRIEGLLLSNAINLNTPCLVAFEDPGDEEKAMVMLGCDKGWIVADMTDDLYQLSFANWPSHGVIVDTLENALAYALKEIDSPTTVPGIYSPAETNTPQ